MASWSFSAAASFLRPMIEALRTEITLSEPKVGYN